MQTWLLFGFGKGPTHGSHSVVDPIEDEKMGQYNEFKSDNIPRPFADDHGIIGTWFLGDIHVVGIEKIIYESDYGKHELGIGKYL